jgi:hypothetical protein
MGEATADECPPEGELHIAAAGERHIAIAVNLEHAPEAGEVLDRSLGLAIGSIEVGDGWRIGAASWPIVAGIGPELAGLGLASYEIEHGCGGLVGE